MTLYRIKRDAVSNIIVRDISKDSVMYIPFDEANADYQAYLAWVAEGNTAEEWQPDGE